ncbi:NUDIX hydrolase [Candidatus Falkowbacteria bacterium]|nr:NUDIX hydrolase [Candidatus Falkowbacteria bacterium]
MPYEKTNKLHIVAVVAVIRNDQGKYLVLKRRDDEIAYPGMYTFPGGKVEDSDTVEETLVKEAQEEANLDLLPGKVLLKDKAFVRPDGQTVKVFSYLCQVSNPEGLKISEDFTAFAWVNLAELQQLSHVGIEEELIRAEEILASGVDLKILQTKSVRED